MQCINEAFGGVTVHASKPVHGKSSLIHHNGSGLFAGIPSPFYAARYHSLAISNVSRDIEITATAPDGLVMGISHRRFPMHGVQFHPESFLTEHGFRIVENFLKLGSLRSRLP
jgi:anthranilate synthase component 2